ncbi:hypothetical protein [Phenylobacterium sp.]|uniref:hypothetical protein n=1 Tax=Phenylobacterium sp. TaxID=1871053 RepID=UPI00272F3CBF|nr:hypothetical protein [Phenylobacterium sp.]MDP1598749.1 hypothetical protein [Phenylobacterium sp.]MDP3592342.1 hypothetical protein [Phenylobacterium sp.]
MTAMINPGEFSSAGRFAENLCVFRADRWPEFRGLWDVEVKFAMQGDDELVG